jgi:hypothetical protein
MGIFVTNSSGCNNFLKMASYVAIINKYDMPLYIVVVEGTYTIDKWSFGRETNSGLRNMKTKMDVP